MEKYPDNPRKREIKFQLWGWILFVICAVFFIASGLKNRDVLTLVGSVIFFMACIVFLIPLIKRGSKK